MQFDDKKHLVERPVPASSADLLEWHGIDWARVNRNVRNLQIRIAKATKERDWRRVKALQRFLTRSFCGKALAVRRVTENRGRKTPGVDNVVWSTPESKTRGISELKRRGYQPLPLRRVYIPKSNGKLRPLGIPTMKDRAMQALYLLALEPVSETLADPNSYGFRPYRCTADAIKQCRTALSQRTSAAWILEADIEGCFDHISHPWLLDHVPMDREVLRKWLKCGYVESQMRYATEAGTPQGGVISPTLANLALDGLEALLKQHFGKRNSNKVNLVRYADDFIITGASKELLEEKVKPLVEGFMAQRGLRLAAAKTKITHIDEGFDFLGQHVRKYKDKLIIKPAKKNIKHFLDKVRGIISNNKAAKTVNLIRLLNPVIKGWAEYHKTINAKTTYSYVDQRIWQALWRWAKRRHPRKGLRWVKDRYFTLAGSRKWMFHDFAVTEDGRKIVVKLYAAIDTKIVIHKKVEGDLNPFLPEWEHKLEARATLQMIGKLEERKRLLRLWLSQDGVCPVCEHPITMDEAFHAHHIHPKQLGGSDRLSNLVLLHPNCHRQVHFG
jgi:RNA-directed DNA polymerase